MNLVIPSILGAAVCTLCFYWSRRQNRQYYSALRYVPIGIWGGIFPWLAGITGRFNTVESLFFTVLCIILAVYGYMMMQLVVTGKI